MPEFDPLKPNAASGPLSKEDEAIRTADLPSWTLFGSKVSVVPGSIQWDAPSPREVDKLFRRLEVHELIGRGGMGAVYKARQVGLDRFIALKLLPAQICQEENLRAKFEREARTLARLSHPRIVTAYDFGVTEEQHLYILMEYVEGTDLHSLLRKGPLTPAAALQVVEDVCEGLAYAHEQGVVHRDVKPANVLIDGNGRAKIVDFGIARLMQPNTTIMGQTTHAVFGTPDYMAPEQFLSASVDHRADLYALGVIMYEALCRELPRGSVAPPSTRVHVDKRVDRIVDKARQNAPDQRYQSARQMLGELQQARAASGKNGSLSNPSRFGRYLPWRCGAHWSWSVAAACLIIAGLVAASLAWRNRAAVNHPPSALTNQSHPSTPPLPPAVPAQWHDWFVEEPDAVPPSLVKAGDHYVPQVREGEAGVEVTFGPALKNLAARVTYKVAGSAPKPILRLFVHGVGEKPGGEVSYGFYPSNRDWLLIRHEPPESPKRLQTIPRPADFDDSRDTAIELQADANLRLLLNGKNLMVHRKQRPKPGRAMVYVSPNIALRKLEWRELAE